MHAIKEVAKDQES